MKNIISTILLLMCFSTLLAQQEQVVEEKSDTIKVISKAFEKEEKNRNIMLNAKSNVGPRQVNIGLPQGFGALYIHEGGVAMTHMPWTQSPLSVWRYDSNIGKIGLLNLHETVILTGAIGNLVTSEMREGGRKFRGFADLKVNTNKMVTASVNLSGPIKNNWHYSIGGHISRNPGSTDIAFHDYMEETEIFRAQIMKRFNGRKGKIKFGYKYANFSYLADLYFPFRYQLDGSYKDVDGFNLGKDSFYPSTSSLAAYDFVTGERKDLDLVNDNNTRSHVFDFNFEYKFENKVKLDVSSRYMSSKHSVAYVLPFGSYNSSADLTFPVEVPPGSGFVMEFPSAVTRLDGTPYTGAIASGGYTALNGMPLTNLLSRVEFSRVGKKHNWRGGLFHSFYEVGDYSASSGVFFEAVEPQPEMLNVYADLTSVIPGYYLQVNNVDGGLVMANTIAGYSTSKINDFAFYFTDDIDVTETFKLSTGARFSYNFTDGEYYKERKVEDGITTVVGELADYNTNNYAYALSGQGDLKLSAKFGLLADLTYQYTGAFDGGHDLGEDAISEISATNVYYNALGVYLNNPKLNIVSKLTRIKQSGITQYATITNADDPTQQIRMNITGVDIQTVGWTTDALIKPTENAELHLLATFQNPKYDNYSLEAWGETYDYSGKVVPTLSKVLLEIDPAYYLFKKDMKVWASFRYFSKTYANLTNSLYFKSRWESFAGIDYKISKNIDASFKVTNLFDVRGVKGTIQGAETITDASVYDNQIMFGAMLLPRQFELGVKFKF